MIKKALIIVGILAVIALVYYFYNKSKKNQLSKAVAAQLREDVAPISVGTTTKTVGLSPNEGGAPVAGSKGNATAV